MLMGMLAAPPLAGGHRAGGLPDPMGLEERGRVSHDALPLGRMATAVRDQARCRDRSTGGLVRERAIIKMQRLPVTPFGACPAIRGVRNLNDTRYKIVDDGSIG